MPNGRRRSTLTVPPQPTLWLAVRGSGSGSGIWSRLATVSGRRHAVAKPLRPTTTAACIPTTTTPCMNSSYVRIRLRDVWGLKKKTVRRKNETNEFVYLRRSRSSRRSRSTPTASPVSCRKLASTSQNHRGDGRSRSGRSRSGRSVGRPTFRPLPVVDPPSDPPL